jgi:hypothetical protein
MEPRMNTDKREWFLFTRWFAETRSDECPRAWYISMVLSIISDLYSILSRNRGMTCKDFRASNNKIEHNF